MELPPDPFLPDDPRIAGSPHLQAFLEGKLLARAFLDIASFSGLAGMLRGADRDDLELAALFVMTLRIHEVFTQSSKERGLTTEEADARWTRWFLGPLTNEPAGDI